LKKILITGAAGKIGKVLRKGLKHPQRFLRFADIISVNEIGSNEEFISLDVTNFQMLKYAMQDIDCVVHLAGIPAEDHWENILHANIIGTRNIFEAARQADVKRVVFASSNHAMGFYRKDQVIDEDMLPRPDSLYGVSKAFGESMGRYYADKCGLIKLLHCWDIILKIMLRYMLNTCLCRKEALQLLMSFTAEHFALMIFMVTLEEFNSLFMI
jgi:uronate dehydrogenase